MQSALFGVLQKFGHSLPHVMNLRGQMLVTAASPAEVSGVLLTQDARMPLRFQQRNLASMTGLPSSFREGEPDVLAVEVSGRPWVENNSQIVLIVKSFNLLDEDRVNTSRESIHG